MFRYEKTFKFENLGIEINTLEYQGSRQTESNPRINIVIKSQNQSFPAGTFCLVSADTFPTKGKKMSELFYASYRTQDIVQAKAINKIIELYEIVQTKGNEADKSELESFRKHIEESLKKAFLDDDKTAIEPLKFIVPGKRVDESTFDLIDASEYQPRANTELNAEEKAQFSEKRDYNSLSDFYRATELAEHVAAVDRTRSHVVGRVEGIDIEYHGPSPALRQLLRSFSRGQGRYNDFFRPGVNLNASHSTSEPDQDDLLSNYAKPD